MTQPRYRPTPPGGTIPVVVPGDLVLVRKPGLAVWAGAVTVFPEGFQFTLLTLFDTSRARLPGDSALDPHERDSMTWLEMWYADGRYRVADLDEIMPPGQPQGPHMVLQYSMGAWSEGWLRDIWWVTPLPPPGLVELAIHIGGEKSPTGTGHLDGALLADAASSAEVLWPTGKRE